MAAASSPTVKFSSSGGASWPSDNSSSSSGSSAPLSDDDGSPSSGAAGSSGSDGGPSGGEAAMADWGFIESRLLHL